MPINGSAESIQIKSCKKYVIFLLSYYLKTILTYIVYYYYYYYFFPSFSSSSSLILFLSSFSLFLFPSSSSLFLFPLSSSFFPLSFSSLLHSFLSFLSYSSLYSLLPIPPPFFFFFNFSFCKHEIKFRERITENLPMKTLTMAESLVDKRILKTISLQKHFKSINVVQQLLMQHEIIWRKKQNKTKTKRWQNMIAS